MLQPLPKLSPALLLLILYGCIQWPFLEADADLLLSGSRGPWTDEGIYTLQIRNWLNTGIWNIEETDAFLRAPLFNLMLLPFFFLLGCKWAVARLFVQGFVILSCLYLLPKNSAGRFSPLFFILFLLYPLLFHHSHLVMAEMPATCMILLGLHHFALSMDEDHPKHYWYSQAWLLAAAFCKISFLYVIILLPLSAAVLFPFLSQKRVQLKKHLMYAGLALLLTVCLFYFAWYLPQQQFIRYMFSVQNQMQFDSNLKAIWERVKSTHALYRVDPYHFYSFHIFYVNLAILPVLLLLRKKISLTATQKARLAFCLLWLLVESFKFSNIYLPSRYLISTSTANLLLFFLLTELLVIALPVLSRAILVCSAAWVVLFMSQLKESYERRSFSLQQVNQNLYRQLDPGKGPVMGNWAASCCWQSKVYIKPLVRSVHNDENTLERWHPQMIIGEADEADSDKAFLSRGINLADFADTVTEAHIAHWQLKFYRFHH